MSARLQTRHTDARSGTGTDGRQLADLLSLIPGFVSSAVDSALARRPMCELVTDSRQVADGDIFLAIKTPFSNGATYINAALENGALCVLVDSELLDASGKLDAAHPEQVIPVEKLSSRAAHLARDFYADPSNRMPVIGITGTNGKSSCAHFLAQMAATIRGRPGGMLGTLGWGLPGQLQALNQTTPDSVSVQRLLARLVADGACLTAMEVSSHALQQQRAEGVSFAVTAFTNLSQDHLDYHPDMASYAQAKQRLFTDYPSRAAVIGIDDEYGAAMALELRRSLPASTPLLTTSAANSGADVCVRIVSTSGPRQGLTLDVATPWGEERIETVLLGAFNAANLATCIACLGTMQIPFAKIVQAAAELQPVPGRMQCVPAMTDQQPLVIVDYAHTPDALASALRSSRGHTRASLWCVFGCGGERDRGKRPQMGRIAERLADKIIITSDNPRREDPQAILDDVRRGLEHPGRAQLEADRAQAIRMAIIGAAAGDCILIAGKGHEQTQQIGDQKLPFDDVEAAARILEQTAC